MIFILYFGVKTIGYLHIHLHVLNFPLPHKASNCENRFAVFDTKVIISQTSAKPIVCYASRRGCYRQRL